jgi:glycosyltransferase involved in cell wall biosynthesis
MKVAHLIDTLWWGGAQIVLVDFANSAIPRGLDMLVIVVRWKMESPYPSLLEQAGARVRFLSATTLYDPTVLPQLLAILREEKVDILHTHLSHVNIWGGIAGRLAGIPVIATLHNVRLPAKRKASIRAVIERLVLRFLTTKLTAVGKNVADTHDGDYPPEKVRIIPPPVKELEALSETDRCQLRKEIAGDSARIIALAVGRFVPQKGLPDLLSAFAEVHRQRPDVVLALAGDGDQRAELEEQARSLSLDGSVRFLGYREDISDLLGTCDLYVSSSHREGFSRAMLEAMSAGLPVLATSVGDACQLLADGRGVLVPPGDVQAFAGEFLRLLENPGALGALGDKGRAYVHKNHSVDAWLDALLEIYTSLTGKRP